MVHVQPSVHRPAAGTLLQDSVANLEVQLSSLKMLDSELKHIAERSDQLHAENTAQRAQLQQLAAAAERAEGDAARLQRSLDAMRVEETKARS
jgi:hypothetical protein